MAASTYNQLVWLVDTIRSAGKITKQELDKQWEKSPLNTKKEKAYPMRSFHRHREHITKFFGLYISCDKCDGHKYYLSKVSDYQESFVRLQLCNILSFTNLLLEQDDLQKRVFFQVEETGQEHLSVLLNAMRNKRAVLLRFKKEADMLPIAVIPYCVKEVDHKWLLAAKPADGNSEVQVYHLTEVESATITNMRLSMPRWFNAEVFFASWLETHQPKTKAAKKEKTSKDVSVKADKAAKAKSADKAAKVKNADKAVAKTAPQEQAQLSLF